MKIVNFEEKEMIPLTNKTANVCHIYKRFSNFKNDENTFKLYHKVRNHCHYIGIFRGAAHSICNLRYKTPKEIPAVFLNGSTYDYHFIIKQLAKEFEGRFKCLGENTEKSITFSVPIKKEFGNSKAIRYKLKFIDSFRFMSTSLLSICDDLSEIYRKKCENKNCKSASDFIGIKYIRLLYKFKCKKKATRTNT